MKVDIVIATYNRADTLKQTIENVLQTCLNFENLFIVDNGSSDHTQEVLKEISLDKMHVVRNKENLGAAAGKNIGLRRSSADVIIVIDDDAVFSSNNPVDEVRKLFKENPRLGVIQFKIINFQTNKVLRYEFPSDNPDRDQNKSFNIGYFIGAGHAIRKASLDKVGYYPDDFGLYAHEEVDLSYRMINAGYEMKYCPQIAVLHKKAPSGRMPKRDVMRQLLLNRLLMSHKYLPFPYLFINNTLWLAKTLINSRSLILVCSTFQEYLECKGNIAKQELSASSLEYMRRYKGRLFR